ncbi:hypothetical protein T440DRAFT_547029 [Plenodomus tracheiphilus IPT5]|uniref:Uncharacterized protein n=1 Tax=Plenodomus tracheiphilus IPT5 TaxID=1408161 RepID=A0A6A7ARQ6_9PLEO|nr:hypothetical protein T440DRAFT_547029 [Plenodomus tracheiphilus IPT5]
MSNSHLFHSMRLALSDINCTTWQDAVDAAKKLDTKIKRLSKKNSEDGNILALREQVHENLLSLRCLRKDSVVIRKVGSKLAAYKEAYRTPELWLQHPMQRDDMAGYRRMVGELDAAQADHDNVLRMLLQKGLERVREFERLVGEVKSARAATYPHRSLLLVDEIAHILTDHNHSSHLAIATSSIHKAALPSRHQTTPLHSISSHRSKLASVARLSQMDLDAPLIPRSQEDAATINTAIKALTLDNPTAVTEFYRRRAIVAADTSLLPDIRDRGIELFDSALRADMPMAINEGGSVVRLLRRTIKSMGALYVENMERVARNERVMEEEEVDGDEKSKGPRDVGDEHAGDEADAEVQELDAGPLTATPEPRAEYSKAAVQMSRSERKAATKRKRQLVAYDLHARLARRKLEQDSTAQAQDTASPFDTNNDPPTPTTGPTTSTPKSTPRNPSTLRTRPRTHTHATSTTALNNPSQSPPLILTQDPHPKNKTTFNPLTNSPSLIVKLSFSSLTSKVLFRAPPAGPVGVAKKKPTVDGGEAVERYIRDVDDEGVSWGEERGERGGEQKTVGRGGKTTRGKRGRGFKSDMLIEDSDGDEDGDEEDNEDDDVDLESNHDTNSTSENSIANDNEATTKSPPRTASPPTPNLTPALHPSPHTFIFPPLPSLPKKHIPPFHRGALIALSNLYEDSLASPSSTLRDLVEELEDERPVVEGWERRVVLEGAGWVFEGCRGVWEGEEQMRGVEGVRGDGEEGEMEGLGEGEEGKVEEGKIRTLDADINDEDGEEDVWLDENPSSHGSNHTTTNQPNNTHPIHTLLSHLSTWLQKEYSRVTTSTTSSQAKKKTERCQS